MPPVRGGTAAQCAALVLLVTGVTFVGRDGARASRGRLSWRVVITWGLPSAAFLLACASMSVKSPICAVLAFGVAFLYFVLGRKSAFGQFLGRDAALRRPVGAARRPYQKLTCARLSRAHLT